MSAACNCRKRLAVGLSSTLILSTCDDPTHRSHAPSDAQDADERPKRAADERGRADRLPSPGEFAPTWRVGDRWTVRNRGARRRDPSHKRWEDSRIETTWNFEVLEIDDKGVVTIQIENAVPNHKNSEEPYERREFVIGEHYAMRRDSSFEVGGGRGVPLLVGATGLGGLNNWPAFPFLIRDGAWSSQTVRLPTPGGVQPGSSDSDVTHEIRQEVEFETRAVVVTLVDQTIPMKVVQRWEPGKPWWTSATVPVYRDECREDLLCSDAEVVQWGGPPIRLPRQGDAPPENAHDPQD